MFSLGSVTFGQQNVTAPAGLSLWTTYVPYDIDGLAGSTADDIVVKIAGALVSDPADPGYGRLTWALRSLDPLTGVRPTDPMRGFLPPNVTTPQGEGSVSFSVLAQPGLVEGDIIGNSASIVFDVNPPILTPVWINALDKAAPVSRVTWLAPEQSSATFTVSWSGTDAGSGIASYDVFVSDNGAAATAWLVGTMATSASFTGLDGHTYGFYSVARDVVGHVEAAPTAPDTTTVVDVPPPVLSAEEQIRLCIALVQSLDLKKEKQLTDKLEQALKELAKDKKNTLKQACEKLDEFLKKLGDEQKQGTLTAAQAAPLVACARQAQTTLDCP